LDRIETHWPKRQKGSLNFCHKNLAVWLKKARARREGQINAQLRKGQMAFDLARKSGLPAAASRRGGFGHF
jgi:hypothetical protein